MENCEIKICENPINLRHLRAKKTIFEPVEVIQIKSISL
jgi:hypothetical protein